MRILIDGGFLPDVTPQQYLQTKALGRLLLQECPSIQKHRDTFRHLVVERDIGDEPTLHLDDFSETPVIGEVDDSQVLQQRARLRACDGDYVALSHAVEDGFAEYCRDQLDLGEVKWLVPKIDKSPRFLALDCWKDRDVRSELIRAVRRRGLRYIHPHVSTLHIWELATLLHTATRRPISVIGPHPALARWSNDKIEFTRTVARLFGKDAVPETESAYNFATLSQKVERLATTHSRLGIKFPYGTGGRGNFLIDANEIRGRSLSKTREFLKRRLSGHRWPRTGRVLIDVWEQNVIGSPSVQTWIPPQGSGDPIMEGLFMQTVAGESGAFEGSGLVSLPSKIEQQIVNSSYLLALLFQLLGYVGRCSFDLILVGEDVNDCRIEFIECNARWGGTSIPMTLMNRLDLNQAAMSWRVRKTHVAGLEKISFKYLVSQLQSDLFDHRTKKGRIVLFNPGGLRARSTIEAIAISDSMETARRILDQVLPERLNRIIELARPGNSTLSAPESDQPNSQNQAKPDNDLHSNGIYFIHREHFMKVQNTITGTAIRQLMTRQVIKVMADDSLVDVVNLMQEHDLTTIPVVGTRGECIGIISRSDLTELFLAEDNELTRVLDTPRMSTEWLYRSLDTCDVRHVKELMTDVVNTIPQDRSLLDACQAFVKYGIHHLPVVDDQRRVVGMISTFDVVRAIAKAHP